MEKTRVITAVVALPLFLLVVWLGGWWLGILLAVLGLIGCYEYAQMVKQISTQQPLMWYASGFVYIAAGFLAIFGLREVNAILWLLIVIWSTDIAAYEIGRRFGRQKLAPKTSPNKTWEGAIAGCIAAVLLGGAYAAIFLHVHIVTAFFVSLLLSCVGQIGDLVESHIKRLSGIKNSGKILPGHGGILDRFDSMLLGAMFLYIIVLLIF